MGHRYRYHYALVMSLVLVLVFLWSKPKQTRSLGPVGRCDRQEHFLMMKLNLEISPSEI